MEKARSSKSGRFVETDYSPYIGKTFNCCTLIKVFRKGTNKRAIVRCIHCGKEKEINANTIFNNPERFCSCDCLGNHKKYIKRMRKKYYDESYKNARNTSGWTGIVHITKSHGRPVNIWRATVCHNNIKYYCGEFHNKKDAVIARREFIKKKGWLNEK